MVLLIFCFMSCASDSNDSLSEIPRSGFVKVDEVEFPLYYGYINYPEVNFDPVIGNDSYVVILSDKPIQVTDGELQYHNDSKTILKFTIVAPNSFNNSLENGTYFLPINTPNFDWSQPYLRNCFVSWNSTIHNGTISESSIILENELIYGAISSERQNGQHHLEFVMEHNHYMLNGGFTGNLQQIQ